MAYNALSLNPMKDVKVLNVYESFMINGNQLASKLQNLNNILDKIFDNSGAVELPAYAIFWPLLDRVGRRIPLAMCLIVGGCCGIATAVITQYFPGLFLEMHFNVQFTNPIGCGWQWYSAQNAVMRVVLR